MFKRNKPSKQKVLDQLRQVRSPDLESNIVDQGLVSEIFINDGKVLFSIAVPSEQAEELDGLRLAAEKIVGELKGVKQVTVALTAEKKPGSSSPPKTKAKLPEPAESRAEGLPPKKPVEGIKAIIAVASGKGGVGKSTTSVNLALGLAELGLKVGMLDADIYGPSLPRLLGLSGKPEQGSANSIKPMQAHGMKVMSMGSLVGEDTPVVWRGPMVIRALTQMLRDVEWGELDVLVVDMPPGTGDAQLTMAQQVPLAGAVIVSTPQDLALIDARKGIAMFEKVDIPILGIVENMSFFIAPDTGKRYDIFGSGGAKAEAKKSKIDFLGEVPLIIAIREQSDAGTPPVIADANSEPGRIYRSIAKKIKTKLKL